MLLLFFLYLTLDLDLLDVANALKWAFLVLPNYCLGQGLTDIFNNYNALDFFNKALDMCLRFESPATCEKRIREYFGSQLEFQENYLSWDNPGIGRYLVFLALEGIVFYSLLLLIEYGVFNRLTGIFRRSFSTVGLRSEESLVAEDDDVLEEKRRVMSSENMDDVLAIKELTKVFSGNGREYNSLACVAGAWKVVGERENGRVRGRHARGEGATPPLAYLLLARPFFLVPTTSKQANNSRVFVSYVRPV